MGEDSSSSGVDELAARLYQQLRVLARSERRRSGGPDTLHTTALVNEVYLKLADAERLRFGEPRQFFAYAAQAMRHILLDRAKLQTRLKRADSRLRVSLTDPDVEAISVDPNDAVVLDAALTELAKLDTRAAQVVDLHFFAGLGLQRIADLLGVHRRTVDRDWRFASAFLKSHLV
ncbi:RNA polymerase sigma factor (TIGR02999 family) [Tahibacter aquaticus]|uniref:RNA polymerase sigma factor (TIGR02999 family) n=1 Tax=Tahibacter aquaticus TaxID=520092 RepID=A0A4R6YN53_9GAMM|nr:ECF-type sigma factor [Tahibacter aquaticus]TDR38901.1 RNA polymerase sigma factor (TIGR02999 family) [Tahibacter aquaticus]